MDEKFRKQLEDNGADVKGTIQRFMGNEALYLKFLMRFLDDTSYEAIRENLSNKDYPAVFNSAHTLKGVAANLGLDPVSAAAAKISDALKNKPAEEVNGEQIEEYAEQLGEVNRLFVKILEENKQ
ncbi:MAG: Hpt domain-containing protein [Muribaculum sp.]|nr:Hpt domain-containing protein [Muribaculum sp.]